MMGVEQRNVYLCGFMATGKSSVGRRLAAALHCEFLDMDALIEAEAGMSISEIFSSQGEPAFRAMESRMVERLGKRPGCVIATGGGAIVNPRNLENMKRSGVVITLTADIPTILRRSGNEDTRPLLQTPDRLERIRTLLEQRAPFYDRADIIVDTSSLSIDEVVAVLLNRLQQIGQKLQ
ncbi:MAG TPA: shikimate kinase [Acidobacteriota bacterium]|nr:shikimate kinase [Acidobacteriota bacterium]